MNAPDQHVIEVIAHRGMGSAFVMPDQPPENTLPSFEAAWNADADACEIDVHLTSDNHVICIHDATTGRTSDADLHVSKHTLAELQQLDAGGWKGSEWSGVRFPELSDVLATIPDGRRLFVEIKTGPAIVPHLARTIRESGRSPEQVVIISFNCESLAASKAALPGLRHYFLVNFEQDSDESRWDVGFDRTSPGTQNSEPVWQRPADTGLLIDLVCEHGFDGLDVSEAQPDDFARQMQNAGLEWIVWTVDSKDMALAMADNGAMSITTNRLREITTTLHAHGYRTRLCNFKTDASGL